MKVNFNPTQLQNLKQMQRLMMSAQMQQAIHLMQMPIMELSAAVNAELEENPIIEYDEVLGEEAPQEEDLRPEQEVSIDHDDFEVLKRLDQDFKDLYDQSENYRPKRSAEEEKLKAFIEQSIVSKETLFEHLMAQAKETFESDEDLAVAEVIIGNLDRRGYLQVTPKEIALLDDIPLIRVEHVLSEIQTFDPYGVGGVDLRECLMIQLRCLKREHSLAYQIINFYFDHLLRNRIPEIKRSLGCTAEELQSVVQKEIAHLDFYPGTLYSGDINEVIVPDVAIIEGENGSLSVEVNQKEIPVLRLNARYLQMLENPDVPKEDKEFIQQKLASAKWLLKNIDQRNDTLYRVVDAIVRHQREFFLRRRGQITPLTLKVIAEELELHESTVARAVSNKYANTPKGLYPLRHFFSNAYVTAAGKRISSKSVREVLKKVIDEENKKHPYSDEQISKILEGKGIPCARRTVAKYRGQMQIGNTIQRKEFH